MSVYNTQMIATPAQCQSLIKAAEADKLIIQTRIVNLNTSFQQKSTKGPDIEAAHTSVEASIPNFQAFANSLPDGDDLKDEMLKRVKRMEILEIDLSNRVEKFGVVQLLGIQLDLAIANLILNELQLFIDAVKARETELTAA
jgi:hypothetical protein